MNRCGVGLGWEGREEAAPRLLLITPPPSRRRHPFNPYGPLRHSVCHLTWSWSICPCPHLLCAAPPILNILPSPISSAGDTVVKPYIMGEEMRKGEKPQDLADMMPSWVG